MTVGMSAVDDSLDPDSNTGSCVTVVAPGVKIASASSDLTDYDDNDAIYDEDGNIVVWTGTSMATPMVAGALALYAEAMGGGGAQTVNALLRRATTGVLTQTTDRDTACVGNDRLLRGPGDGGDLDGSDLGEEPCALPAGYYACLVDCDCAGLAADGCGGACDAWEQRSFLRKACASNDAPPFNPATCEDTPGWVDGDGDGCADYESRGWCARWGWFGEFTPTGPANLNCCACRAYIAQHDAEFERRPTWEGGWCAGGADRCFDDIYNRADCWAKCVKKMGDDLVAADFWIHDDGQCCCQDACVCATEVGIPGGETLVKVPVCADDGEWFAKKAKKDCDWVRLFFRARRSNPRHGRPRRSPRRPRRAARRRTGTRSRPRSRAARRAAAAASRSARRRAPPRTTTRGTPRRKSTAASGPARSPRSGARSRRRTRTTAAPPRTRARARAAAS